MTPTSENLRSGGGGESAGVQKGSSSFEVNNIKHPFPSFPRTPLHGCF